MCKSKDVNGDAKSFQSHSHNTAMRQSRRGRIATERRDNLPHHNHHSTTHSQHWRPFINKYKYINLTRLKFFNIYWKTKSSAPNKPQRSGRRWKPLVVLVVVVLEVLPGVVMPGPSRGDAGRTNQGEVGPSSGENYHVVYDDDCASEDDVDNYHYMNYC